MNQHPKHYFSFVGTFFHAVGLMFSNSYVGKLSKLFIRAMASFIFNLKKGVPTQQQISWQVYFTGVGSFPLIAIVSFLLGSVVILQALTVMPKVGLGDFFGNIMVLVVIRELGPLLTAFLIAGRTGSALATYIGNMKVHNEVDALRTLSIDPIAYLVMPSIFGGMISMIVLTIWFNVIAIIVGYMVAKLSLVFFSEAFDFTLQWSIFSQGILNAMSPIDIVLMIVKPLAFGIIITTTACFHGLAIAPDIRNVPKATYSSVVSSFILVVFANVFLSMFYISQYLSQFSRIL